MTLRGVERLLQEAATLLEQAEMRQGDYLGALSDAVQEVAQARDAVKEIIGS